MAPAIKDAATANRIFFGIDFCYRVVLDLWCRAPNFRRARMVPNDSRSGRAIVAFAERIGKRATIRFCEA
jgi:hypothetical protein